MTSSGDDARRCLPSDPLPRIRTLRRTRNEVLVVVDDDPTGTQTLSDIDVVTDWDPKFLASLMRDQSEFFILANTRAISSEAASSRATEIGECCRQAAKEAGRHLTILSRSDSTLRGHFPSELYALCDGADLPEAQIVLAPAFLEMRRVTIEDVHYAEHEGTRVPVAETPFADDESFGFKSSNLVDWVVERSGGMIAAHDVISLTAEILSGGDEAIGDALERAPHAKVAVANATSYSELDAIASGCLLAEEGGSSLIYRTASSFVRSRLGRSDPGPIDISSLGSPGRDSDAGGLVVCGSHVPLSSAQLAALLRSRNATPIELSPSVLWDDARREEELSCVSRTVSSTIRGGSTAVLFTSRGFFRHPQLDPFSVSASISAALVDVVKRLSCKPSFLIAKGGITSSDIATRSLAMRRARVLGQIAPGVSVWRMIEAAGARDFPYVVFPGNVGSVDTLTEVVDAMISWASSRG